jgi:hypothetical protein
LHFIEPAAPGKPERIGGDPEAFSGAPDVTNVREAIAGVLDVMKANGAEPERNIQVLDLAV